MCASQVLVLNSCTRGRRLPSDGASKPAVMQSPIVHQTCELQLPPTSPLETVSTGDPDRLGTTSPRLTYATNRILPRCCLSKHARPPHMSPGDSVFQTTTHPSMEHAPSYLHAIPSQSEGGAYFSASDRPYLNIVPLDVRLFDAGDDERRRLARPVLRARQEVPALQYDGDCLLLDGRGPLESLLVYSHQEFPGIPPNTSNDETLALSRFQKKRKKNGGSKRWTVPGQCSP